MRYLKISVIIFFLIFQLSAFAADVTKLSIHKHFIHAELAETEQARATGLMHRTSLCLDCGMLFVFPSADKWAFWSRNTPLALSVAFIDKAGRITQIVDMDANSDENHTSDFNVIYALEMPRGWFLKNKISAGDKLEGIK
jgi:hypothetical protein